MMGHGNGPVSIIRIRCRTGLDAHICRIDLHHPVGSHFSCGIRSVGEIQAIFQGYRLGRTAVGLIADRGIVSHFPIIHLDVISMVRVAVGRVCYLDALIRRGHHRTAVLQLGNVDCIIVSFAVGHIGDELVIGVQARIRYIRLLANGQSLVIDDRVARSDAVEGRSLANFYRNRLGIFRRRNNGIVFCLEIQGFAGLDAAACSGIGIGRNCKASLFQLRYVHRIRIFTACRHVRNLAGNGLFSTHITNRYGTCRRRPGAVVGRIYGGRFQIGFLFHAVHFISCGPGGGRPIAQGHTAIYIGTGGRTQSGCIGSRSSGVIPYSHRLRSIK